MCSFQSGVEYRKCKRPFLPTARAHLVADPRHRKPPSSRSPVREAREAAWQAACRSPPDQRAAQSRSLRVAGSGRAASGTVGLAGAWVKSPLPVHRVPGRRRGSPRPPEPFAAAPSEPPQPCGLPVTSHRFCSCPASEPAAYRLPTGLRQRSWACNARGALCYAIGECSFSTVGSSCPSTADSPLEGPPARAL